MRTGYPRARSSSLAARASTDLPLPGMPVIQIAQLMTASPASDGSTSGIERGSVRPWRARKRSSVARVVSARFGYQRGCAITSARNAKNGGSTSQQLLVAAPAEIAIEEAAEEREEGFGHTVVAQRRALPQPEEQVVDGERAHVVGRLAPLAAAPVQDRELGAFTKQQIPGMKVAVDSREAMVALTQAPAPRHQVPLERLAVGGRQQRIGMRIAVEDPHQAFAVPDQLADPSVVERRLGALVGMHTRRGIARGAHARSVSRAPWWLDSSRSRSSQ